MPWSAAGPQPTCLLPCGTSPLHAGSQSILTGRGSCLGVGMRLGEQFCLVPVSKARVGREGQGRAERSVSHHSLWSPLAQIASLWRPRPQAPPFSPGPGHGDQCSATRPPKPSSLLRSHSRGSGKRPQVYLLPLCPQTPPRSLSPSLSSGRACAVSQVCRGEETLSLLSKASASFE